MVARPKANLTDEKEDEKEYEDDENTLSRICVRQRDTRAANCRSARPPRRARSTLMPTLATLQRGLLEVLHEAMPSVSAANARPWYLGATPLGTLSWLVRLRWTTAAIEAMVVLVAGLFPHADFPLHRIALLVAVCAVSNALVAFWLSRRGALPRMAALASLTLEVLLLSGLLELTGGPFNPFSVLYAVHIALAAVTLGGISAWAIGVLAAICYGVLFYWHTLEIDEGHHRLNDFPTHLFSVWIAIAATAELATHFIAQASNALAKREEELEAMRARAARSERLISLTTLAAGAAHELSTPLATIALASRELQRSAEAHTGPATASLADDARLIRAEVDRCQAILDQMSGRAGGIAADDPERVDVSTAIAELTSRLPADRAGRLQVEITPTLPPLHVPRAGFAQVVLSLVNNAFDASPPGTAVWLTAAESQARGTMRLTVHDRGQRVAPDVLRRAGEPFFTTKDPGRGLGLGLFLARVFAERCGGSLTLESDHETRAVLELPVRADLISGANAS